MGHSLSTRIVIPSDKFNVFFHGFSANVIAQHFPHEIVDLILAFIQFYFKQYKGKFIKQNVGRSGMRPLEQSDLGVICHNKGVGASAKLDTALPMAGTEPSSVYFWKVKFIDNYNRTGALYLSSQAFIGVVSEQCTDFDAMITEFVGYYSMKHKMGYYSMKHKILKDAYGVTCNGDVYIESKKDTETQSNKEICYMEIVHVLYFVGSSQLIFRDDNDTDFCKIDLPPNKEYYPVVSAINNVNNMDIITLDMNYTASLSKIM
eukprot:851837_1